MKVDLVLIDWIDTHSVTAGCSGLQSVFYIQNENVNHAYASVHST